MATLLERWLKRPSAENGATAAAKEGMSPPTSPAVLMSAATPLARRPRTGPAATPAAKRANDDRDAKLSQHPPPTPPSPPSDDEPVAVPTVAAEPMVVAPLLSPSPSPLPGKRKTNDDGANSDEDASQTADDGGDSDFLACGDDYEAMRQRNIEANNRLLAQLGLLGPTAKPARPAARPPAARVPKRRPTFESDAVVTWRRESPRLRARGSTSADMAVAIAVVGDALDDATAKPAAAALPALGHALAPVHRDYTRAEMPADHSGCLYLTGHRHLIYSQSFGERSVTSDGTLLAAAGAEGLVSLFALPSLENGGLRRADADAEPESRTPVAIVPVHRRWIADVQWVSSTADASSRLLLTVADDGLLQLSRVDVATAEATVQVVPLARLGAELHHGGIYSMEEVGGMVATSSKDDSVGVSTLHPAGGLAVTRAYRDIGAGVVKAVRWQRCVGPSVLACGGNDHSVRVFDLRQAHDAPVFMLEDAHAGAVNTVAFSPAAEWQLLSSGFDGAIRLWDLRAGVAPTSPWAEFTGHHGRAKPGLMHPVYALDGRAIVTGGQNSSHLFLYDVAARTLGNVVTLGWTPGSLHAHPLDESRLLASSGKNGLWLLNPLRLLDGDSA